MSQIKSYHLIKEKGNYVLLAQIGKKDAEFSIDNYLMVDENKKIKFYDEIKEHIKKRFPYISIPICKVMVGSIPIATIPLSNKNIIEKDTFIESEKSIYYKDYQINEKENLTKIALEWKIPVYELLMVNKLNENSKLKKGQIIRIPIHNIPIKKTLGKKHGEYLDWWTEAQYLFPLNKIAKVKDFYTKKTFTIKRTGGISHGNCEPLTYIDTEIAKSIWKEFSWDIRPILLLINERKIAASMSFMPHGTYFITNNKFNGHFNVCFLNSVKQNDKELDFCYQEAVKIAAGLD